MVIVPDLCLIQVYLTEITVYFYIPTKIVSVCMLGSLADAIAGPIVIMLKIHLSGKKIASETSHAVEEALLFYGCYAASHSFVFT